MTGRRRLRMCVRGVVQGVGFRPFVYTTAAALGLTGSVRNDAPASSSRSRATRRRSTAFAGAGCATTPPPLAVVESVETPSMPPSRRHRLHHRGHLAIRRRPHARLARRRDLRRLPAPSCRPGRPALPPPVHQLHQLRSAVHHHHRAALRPRRHHDGRLPDVRRLRARVPRSRPTAGSTPSRSPAPTAGRRCATWSAPAAADDGRRRRR